MPEVRRRRVEEDDDDKPVARRRDRARVEEPDDKEPEDDPRNDEDDDTEPEEKPRRRSRKSAEDEPPPGIHVGLEGAERVAKSGAGTISRLTLSKEPELVKVLENGPFASYKQHWVKQGGNQNDKPYTCPETDDCPLCAMGHRWSKVFVFNVLHLSPNDGKPTNKILQVGVKAYNSFKSTATPRGKDKPAFDKDYWAISRSGQGTSSQTNFNPVKERDLEEDWEEIFDEFEPADLGDIIEESCDHMFDWKIIQKPLSNKELRDVARHLTEEDDEDD